MIDIERQRASRLRWYHANKEKMKEKRRAWQQANPDKALAATKKWQAKNRDKCRSNSKRYRAANRERLKGMKRKWDLKRAYDMTVDEYNTMLALQNAVCAICKQPPKGLKPLHIDHCHESKLVRGLLCMSCNNGIGRFKHSPELLRAAAAYLENVPCP